MVAVQWPKYKQEAKFGKRDRWTTWHPFYICTCARWNGVTCGPSITYTWSMAEGLYALFLQFCSLDSDSNLTPSVLAVDAFTVCFLWWGEKGAGSTPCLPLSATDRWTCGRPALARYRLRCCFKMPSRACGTLSIKSEDGSKLALYREITEFFSALTDISIICEIVFW